MIDFYKANMTLHDNKEALKSSHVRQPQHAFLACTSVLWVTESPQYGWGEKELPEVNWSNIPRSSRATETRWSGTTATQLLSFSKEGDPMSTLGHICHCSVTVTAKKGFLVFKGKVFALQCFALCLLPLGIPWKSLAQSSLHPPISYRYTSKNYPLQSLLQVEESVGSTFSTC